MSSQFITVAHRPLHNDIKLIVEQGRDIVVDHDFDLDSAEVLRDRLDGAIKLARMERGAVPR